LSPLLSPRLSVLTLVACFASGCYEPPLTPRDPSPGAAHYYIQTYNILQQPIQEATVEAIGAAGADIVALQEVSDAWADVIVERYADTYEYMMFYPNGASGLGVLSHFPLEDAGFHEGPNGWHPAWHVWVHTPAGPLQLLNVHLRAVFDGTGGVVRSFFNVDEDHRDEITLYEQNCDAALPTVILGDFNEDPSGAAVRTLEALGFRNLLPLFRPGQTTWSMRSVGDQMAETVDHILIDDRSLPLNAFVVDAGASDHIPVVAHLEAQNW